MDGIKEKLNSLQFRLALAMTLIMVIAAIAIAVIGFYSTLHDAHELQDDHLRDVAAMADGKRLFLDQSDILIPGFLEDPDAHVLVQLIGAGGQAGSAQNYAIKFPDDLDVGLHTIHLRHIGWRVFVQPFAAGGKLVVAQKTEVRNEIAEHAGFRTLFRVLAVIPFLILLLVIVLRWMLRPLASLSDEINVRHSDDVRALPDQGLPSELRPFIFSINAMLQRISSTLDAQRRFVADAAHELRSPLTALTLQTKNFSMQEMSEEAHLKLGEFSRGLQRANDLVDQLLAMARAQLLAPVGDDAVSMQQIVRSVFEEMMPFADSRQIELGFEQSEDIVVSASQIDLNTVLRNLVDNAIRYTAPLGMVDVRIQSNAGWISITVIDNGPGIPQDQRERVFDPFYRVLGSGQSGSGLGLSIVKTIVNNLHGVISLSFADPVSQSGTAILVKIPTRHP